MSDFKQKLQIKSPVIIVFFLTALYPSSKCLEPVTECYFCDSKESCNAATLAKESCPYGEHSLCWSVDPGPPHIDDNYDYVKPRKGCIDGDDRERHQKCTAHEHNDDYCYICETNLCNQPVNRTSIGVEFCYCNPCSQDVGFKEKVNELRFLETTERCHYSRGSPTKCYSRTLESGKAEWGCTLQRKFELSCDRDPNCYLCTSNFCNNESIVGFVVNTERQTKTTLDPEIPHEKVTSCPTAKPHSHHSFSVKDSLSGVLQVGVVFLWVCFR